MVRATHGSRRNSNRAEDYDYAQNGSYYVTVCTHELRTMFGQIVDGEMVTNEFGQIVVEEWHRLAATRPHIELDAFVLMPNHFHGIIVIHEPGTLVRATPCVARGPFGPGCRSHVPSDEASGAVAPRATHGVARTRVGADTPAPTLGVIVGQIKSASARRINRLRKTPGATVWHRSYYDHIIRNEKDMDRVRAYILDNPINWQYDRANPIVRTGDRLGRPAQHQPTIREIPTL